MPQPHVVVVEGNPRGYRSPAHLRYGHNLWFTRSAQKLTADHRS
jgi:hypothetical protein